MLKSHSLPSLKIAVAIGLLSLAGCTPKYDWREVRGSDAPFTVMLPSKPSVHSRPVDLDGVQVSMTMTAAEVDGTVFAVGSAELPDAAKAQAALLAMKTAMVKNIDGQVKQEKSSGATATSGATTSQVKSIDIEAVGPPTAKSNGQPRLLVARFTAKDKRVYQAIVVGKEKTVSRDAVDTFLSSFQVN